MHVRREILERHVRESNAIERIRVGTSHPLFQDHLKAAHRAVRGPLVHPNELHGLVMHTTRRQIAGRYRTCPLYINHHELPPPDELPKLMDRWWQFVEAYWRTASGGSRKRAAYIAWILHLHLLSIHPYVDGNGRTARLVLNMLRLRARLPWKVVTVREAHSYHQLIRRYEEQVFDKHYRLND